jgi:hypothetical protein
MGVPQGSVLGPLLFNIFLNDLFWILEQTDVCNFADDTTLYACHMDLNTVLKTLEHDSLLAIEWFRANYMKLNTEKCHLLVAGFKHEQVWAKIGNELIWESNEEKLLGVTIDRKLNFEKHIANICQRAHSKLSAIARYRRFLDFDKLKALIKAFVESQFSYCPLVWMFHDRNVNNRINRLHERALRLLYSDDISTFQVLLEKSNEFTIHQRNIQSLAIEMFKAKHNVGPYILQDIFIGRHYTGPKLRTSTDFKVEKVNTVHFGDNSLLCFGRKIWHLIPSRIKDVDHLDSFKNQIRYWKPVKCPCRLCKQFVKDLGYI